MVLGTSLLNSSPAYAVTVLALWAMWRAIVAPSLARDILALAALLLLAITRVGNIVVAAAWPLGILVLRAARPPARGRRRRGDRGLPRAGLARARAARRARASRACSRC